MKSITVFPFLLSKYHPLNDPKQLQFIVTSIFAYIKINNANMKSIDLSKTLRDLFKETIYDSVIENVKFKCNADLNNVEYKEAINTFSMRLFGASKIKGCLLKFESKHVLIFSSSLAHTYFFLDLNKSKLYMTNNLLSGFNSIIESYYGTRVSYAYNLK